jgi:hypothetical protein
VDDFLDPVERLNDLLDKQETRVATIFRSAVEQLKDELDLDLLADLIEQGRLEEALEKVRIVADRLGAASNTVFVGTGQSTADFLTNGGVGSIVFDQVNLQAVAAMQRSRLSLIREFTDEQRKATHAALYGGVEAGSNPRVMARNFRDSVGLTQTQWGHVQNYRDALERVGTDAPGQTAALSRALRDKRGDAQVLRAIRQTQKLPPAKIDWLVNRYASRYVKFRAEVIGRTEALRAVHEGNEEAYRQAIASGAIRANQIEREWRTRVDGRQRDTHLYLNGEKRGWGEPWATRHGIIRYPGDPEAPASEVIQCRCALLTRIRRR